jgi:hypothetical protein
MAPEKIGPATPAGPSPTCRAKNFRFFQKMTKKLSRRDTARPPFDAPWAKTGPHAADFHAAIPIPKISLGTLCSPRVKKQLRPIDHLQIWFQKFYSSSRRAIRITISNLSRKLTSNFMNRD